jgi:hypothetical protein
LFMRNLVVARIFYYWGEATNPNSKLCRSASLCRPTQGHDEPIGGNPLHELWPSSQAALHGSFE